MFRHGSAKGPRNSDFKPIRITETSLTAKIPIFNDTMTQEEALERTFDAEADSAAQTGAFGRLGHGPSLAHLVL